MASELALSTGIEEYLAHLEQVGKSASTVGTARRTLALLQHHFGDEKIVSKILTVHVAGFFKSEAATMQPGKDGPKPRALPSVLQIRRIVRDALVFWHASDYLDSVPLPKDEAKFIKQPKAGKGEAATDADGADGTAETGTAE